MRARFQFTCDPPVARLRITGELDISTGADLRAMFAAIDEQGCRLIELDADEITFIDAYALAVLRHEQRRLLASGGDLEVVAASAWFVLVARLAEYDTLLPTSTPGSARAPAPGAVPARRLQLRALGTREGAAR
jgi:anti-anti-sigma factor